MKQLVKISKVKTNTDNPRIIKDYKFDKLVKSIKEFPDMLEKRPIVVDEDMIVLGGNMRLKACIAAGLNEVWIDVAEGWTEEQKKEFIIKDNLGFGEWDWDILANEWDIQKLDDWGMDLPPMFDDPEPEAVEDDYTEPNNIKVDVVLGDLIEIGEHRLLCGDSTDSDQVAKLMNGEKADMVFTDPPYGIGYEYNSHKDTKGDEYLKFCDEWFDNLQIVSDFIFISTGWAYQKYWWNKNPKDEMYWLSRNKQTGGTVFHFRRIEPLFIWGKPKHKYNFDFFEEITDREDGLRELHTCPKPIKLISSIIEGVDIGDLICDIFLGSGTTMVASHQLKRKCYGMELDPKYCQVIIDRMLKLDSNLEVKINGKQYTRVLSENE